MKFQLNYFLKSWHKYEKNHGQYFIYFIKEKTPLITFVLEKSLCIFSKNKKNKKKFRKK